MQLVNFFVNMLIFLSKRIILICQKVTIVGYLGEKIISKCVFCFFYKNVFTFVILLFKKKSQFYKGNNCFLLEVIDSFDSD